VARAVCSKRDTTWKPVIMPPTAISRASEKICIEAKPKTLSIFGVLKIQKVTGHSILTTYAASIRAPIGQLKNPITEESEMLIRCGKCDLRRSDYNDKTVCRSLWVKCGSLLPQLLLLGDFLCDFFIAPCRYCFFSQEAEVNSPLFGRNFSKLARLTMLTPQIKAFGHFIFSCGSVMEQSIRLKDVVAERVCDPPSVVHHK